MVSIMLMVYDVVMADLSYFLALWLRFDLKFSKIDPNYLDAFYKFVGIYSVCVLVVHTGTRLYRSIWRYASYTELMSIIEATCILSVIHIAGITLLFQRMPISYYMIGMFFQFIFVVFIRFSYRFVLLVKGRTPENNGKPMKNIMLIGAGNAGQMILRDITRSKELRRESVVCIIDDNSNKWGRYIDNVPVVGGRDDIMYCVDKYKVDAIYLAIPSAEPSERRDILNICKETGCELKILPGIYQIVSGEVNVSKMRNVAIEDLLGRETVNLDMSEVDQFLTGKVVMVTGGGGSIGSELCRQIAERRPRQLIIFDVYENNAYAIQQELVRRHPELNMVVLIGSVRDSKRINTVFEEYKPDVVYHAAAHKHVPLMEVSPCEAIKNNVIGTYKTAYAAMMNDVKRFVLISTDKAVNPTNIMGASKRLCEMVIQTFDYMVKNHMEDSLPMLHAHMNDDEFDSISNGRKIHSHTQFSAVRFGNVLGSNGSVIPLFKKQIEEGGPVTVTSPEIIRYFMSIPEAVSLVLQASVLGEGSEIYVLDMAEPVKIADLAKNLIRLSGFTPGVDIEIVYTGLRPGEKLYEEKLMAEEGLRRTKNQKIHIGQPIPFEYDEFIKNMRMLMNVAYREDEDEIYEKVQEMVSTFHPTREKKAVHS